MATIKLTDATWLEYNTERVRGTITGLLGQANEETGERTEIDAATLKRELERKGLKFTTDDLQTIRAVLEGDGTIEIIT